MDNFIIRICKGVLQSQFLPVTDGSTPGNHLAVQFIDASSIAVGGIQRDVPCLLHSVLAQNLFVILFPLGVFHCFGICFAGFLCPGNIIPGCWNNEHIDVPGGFQSVTIFKRVWFGNIIELHGDRGVFDGFRMVGDHFHDADCNGGAFINRGGGRHLLFSVELDFFHCRQLCDVADGMVLTTVRVFYQNIKLQCISVENSIVGYFNGDALVCSHLFTEDDSVILPQPIRNKRSLVP